MGKFLRRIRSCFHNVLLSYSCRTFAPYCLTSWQPSLSFFSRCWHRPSVPSSLVVKGQKLVVHPPQQARPGVTGPAQPQLLPLLKPLPQLNRQLPNGVTGPRAPPPRSKPLPLPVLLNGVTGPQALPP